MLSILGRRDCSLLRKTHLVVSDRGIQNGHTLQQPDSLGWAEHSQRGTAHSHSSLLTRGPTGNRLPSLTGRPQLEGAGSSGAPPAGDRAPTCAAAWGPGENTPCSQMRCVVRFRETWRVVTGHGFGWASAMFWMQAVVMGVLSSH